MGAAELRSAAGRSTATDNVLMQDLTPMWVTLKVSGKPGAAQSVPYCSSTKP